MISLLLTAVAFGPANAYPIDDAERAEAAYAKRDYIAFLANAKATVAGASSDPSALYLLARAYALNGQPVEAVATLAKATDIGGLEVDTAASDKDLASLAERSDFAVVLRRIEQLKQPVRTSQKAYVLTEEKLTPEGTAYDPVTRTLFISSLFKRKIVAIAPDGAVRDFIPEKSDGIWGVAGMEVDPVRRHLWVVSGSPGEGLIKDFIPEDRGKSGIFKYEIDTGKLIAKYLPESSVKAGFNDLTIAKSGDVYITDMGLGAVWRIPAALDKLEIFISPAPQSRRFYNGIAIAPDDRRLFVAHAFGVDLVDLVTKQQDAVAHPENITLGSIDGLSFYENSLIAHQGASIGAISRYFLSPDWKRVTRRQIIDSRLPEFEQATTGAVAGDVYYYIANSQLRRLYPTHPRFGQPYDDVIILRTQLNDPGNRRSY